MAENRNFISAKDLPVSESEEVDVLVVDDGELKRKPAANLGGGNGGETDGEYEGYDVVFKTTESSSSLEVEVAKGSFDVIKEKIEEDKPVSAILLNYAQAGSPWMKHQIALNNINCVDYVGDRISFVFISMGTGGRYARYTINLNSDNSADASVEWFD